MTATDAASAPPRDTPPAKADTLTLVALSCLAYVVAVAVHEHAGHTLACMLVGGRPREMGAFYVDCDDHALGSGGRRAVELAGPLMSVALGLVSYAGLRRITVNPAGYYFVWLLGSLGLMSATGYFLFSGVSGLGDLGTTADGALYQWEPEWLWRLGLTAVGVLGYRRVVRAMASTLSPRLSQGDPDALADARRLTRLSYGAGVAIYVAIGLLNPRGFEIMATSVLPSSMGGTCGLLWMWSRQSGAATLRSSGPGLGFSRQWTWIAAAVVLTAAYAALLGPTLKI